MVCARRVRVVPRRLLLTGELVGEQRVEGLDELETPDLKHLSVLLRHERARGCRSGASVASGAVAPNIAEAAANIIGLDTSLEPDAELLESDARVAQGRLEGSNVDPVGSLVELIALQRYYEAFQQTAKAVDGMDQQLATRVGRKTD